jgi:Mn2+/Fe2+ NRAMP family transporter
VRERLGADPGRQQAQAVRQTLLERMVYLYWRSTFTLIMLLPNKERATYYAVLIPLEVGSKKIDL